MTPRLIVTLALLLIAPAPAAQSAEPATYDVVIYGGTSAGAAAAVQTARMGKSVVLIEPGRHVGGLTISGLGWTDTGNKTVIGGVSREFYQQVKRHYDQDAAWRQQLRAEYDRYRPADDAMWTFEPHVAEQIFAAMLREANVTIVLGKRLQRPDGAPRTAGRIREIRMEDGTVFRGRMFVDATYEGDLMEAAGVSSTVGREANAQYGERLNGVQIARSVHHQFVKPVDPYVVPGDPSSGLLPGINTQPGVDGEADHRVQAYNYRICMTDAADNQVPFEKPDGYDPLQHELLLRNFEAGDLRVPLSIGQLPNRKTDLNNNFAVSTDWIGMNYDYPAADYATREKLLAAHQTYVRGFLWTLANHPRVPEAVRSAAAKWGYARDEFVDNHHFPYGCYIREARRMVSDYVQTELDCRRVRICEDSVGLGSYNMDSHNCQRYVDEHGHVRNEGDVQVSPGGPYAISYRAIVPRREECRNLFVPVCLSSSHIAYGSIRMEPVFMVLGQSAATAACQAIDADCDVQAVPYAALRARLEADGQVLDIPAGAVAAQGIDPAKLPGIVVDDAAARKTGAWLSSSSVPGYVGESYLHDNNELHGEKMIEFRLPIKSAGRYELRLAYAPNGNRATNVLVTVVAQDGAHAVTVNQRQRPPIDGLWVSLGEFELAADGSAAVRISNADANGHVIADAVQALPR